MGPDLFTPGLLVASYLCSSVAIQLHNLLSGLVFVGTALFDEDGGVAIFGVESVTSQLAM